MRKKQRKAQTHRPGSHGPRQGARSVLPKVYTEGIGLSVQGLRQGPTFQG